MKRFLPFFHGLPVLLAAVVPTALLAATPDGIRWEPLYEPGGGGAIVALSISPFDPFDPERIVAGCYGAGFVRARWPKSYRPAGTRKGPWNVLEPTSAKAEASAQPAAETTR